jgi:hypothetical protein
MPEEPDENNEEPQHKSGQFLGCVFAIAAAGFIFLFLFVFMRSC